MKELKHGKDFEDLCTLFWVGNLLLANKVFSSNQRTIFAFRMDREQDIFSCYQHHRFGCIGNRPVIKIQSHLLNRENGSHSKEAYFFIEEKDFLHLPLYAGLQKTEGSEFIETTEKRISRCGDLVAACGIKDWPNYHQRQHPIDFFPRQIRGIVRSFSPFEFMVLNVETMKYQVFETNEEILGVSIRPDGMVVAVVCVESIYFFDLDS